MRSTYWTIGYWGSFYWLPLYWPIRFTDGCPPDSEIESAYQLAVRATTLGLDAFATASLVGGEIESAYRLAVRATTLGLDAFVTASLVGTEVEGILLSVTARAYGDVEVVVTIC